MCDAELQKPKRPARTVYAGADPNKCAATAPPAPTKFRNKRPDKNTGSTPVLGRDSEEPQLAFRREYGSRGAFMELALLVLDGTGGSGSPSDSTACRVTATVQEKNLARSSLALLHQFIFGLLCIGSTLS